MLSLSRVNCMTRIILLGNVSKILVIMYSTSKARLRNGVQRVTNNEPFKASPMNTAIRNTWYKGFPKCAPRVRRGP